MGHPHGLFSLQQVVGEPLQHLLPKNEFIHDEWWASRMIEGQGFIVNGSTNLPRDCLERLHPG